MQTRLGDIIVRYALRKSGLPIKAMGNAWTLPPPLPFCSSPVKLAMGEEVLDAHRTVSMLALGEVKKLQPDLITVRLVVLGFSRPKTEISGWVGTYRCEPGYRRRKCQSDTSNNSNHVGSQYNIEGV